MWRDLILQKFHNMQLFEHLWHHFEQMHLWTFRLKADIRLNSRSVWTRWCNHTWCVSAWWAQSVHMHFNLSHLNVSNCCVKFVKVCVTEIRSVCLTELRSDIHVEARFCNIRTNHALENLNYYDTLSLWDKSHNYDFLCHFYVLLCYNWLVIISNNFDFLSI